MTALRMIALMWQSRPLAELALSTKIERVRSEKNYH